MLGKIIFHVPESTHYSVSRRGLNKRCFCFLWDDRLPACRKSSEFGNTFSNHDSQHSKTCTAATNNWRTTKRAVKDRKTPWEHTQIQPETQAGRRTLSDIGDAAIRSYTPPRKSSGRDLPWSMPRLFRMNPSVNRRGEIKYGSGCRRTCLLIWGRTGEREGTARATQHCS